MEPMIFFLIDVQLIYISGVQQSDSYIYIYISFFRFFSIRGYYKIFNIVPCAIQQVLAVYLFYIQQCVYVNSKLLIYPLRLSRSVTLLLVYFYFVSKFTSFSFSHPFSIFGAICLARSLANSILSFLVSLFQVSLLLLLSRFSHV